MFYPAAQVSAHERGGPIVHAARFVVGTPSGDKGETETGRRMDDLGRWQDQDQ